MTKRIRSKLWLENAPTPQQRKLVALRIENLDPTTYHSAHGETLQWLIRQFEEAGIPYALVARPGEGYALTRTDGALVAVLPESVRGMLDAR